MCLFCGMKQQPMESDRTTVFNSPGLVSRDLPAAAPHSFVLSGFPGHISAVFDTICLGRRVKEQAKTQGINIQEKGLDFSLLRRVGCCGCCLRGFIYHDYLSSVRPGIPPLDTILAGPDERHPEVKEWKPCRLFRRFRFLFPRAEELEKSAMARVTCTCGQWLLFLAC